MGSQNKLLKDRARYNSIADLVSRYAGEFSVLYEGWREYYAPESKNLSALRDKARHAAHRDLVENHTAEYHRLHHSWLTHFQRQAGIDITPWAMERGPKGRFLPARREVDNLEEGVAHLVS